MKKKEIETRLKACEKALGIEVSENCIDDTPIKGVYGAVWEKGKSTKWIRTDDAADLSDPSPAVDNGSGSSPFDDIYPWSDMKRVTDQEAGELAKIPKFWFRWQKAGKQLKLQISPTEQENFYICPAYRDKNVDEAFIARYKSGNDGRSTTNEIPLTKKTRAEFRNLISALGDGIYQRDMAMQVTIWMLYLVEYADWNSQECIGYGCSDNKKIKPTGMTDSMLYHTGTTAKTRQTYGYTQYRYIEGLWDNVLEWYDGIRFDGRDIYVFDNPDDFDDEQGGTYVGKRANDWGIIKNMKPSEVEGYEWMIYPSKVDYNLNYGEFVGDGCYYNASGVVLYGGGYCSQDRGHGLFCLYGDAAASDQYASIGSRLLKNHRREAS